MNKEDQSKEEFYLYNIISACELILDDMEHGANINKGDFNNLGYADGIMHRIQQNVSKDLNPTNINSSQDEWNIAPMTDRIYSDDEHGNAL
tara:strand:- start:255 stop:527 length:273 start_codon:yes stop_codon:yes gene_type:complete